MSLNARVKRPPAAAAAAASARVRVHFDGIVAALADAVASCQGPVVGCVAWLAHPDLRRVLEKRGAQVVVTNDARACASRGKLKVRRVGLKRGAMRPLMHHKFLVLCDARGHPETVWTGSFNFTKHSCENLENIVEIHSASVASHFFGEFEAVWKLGRE